VIKEYVEGMGVRDQGGVCLLRLNIHVNIGRFGTMASFSTGCYERSSCVSFVRWNGSIFVLET
jgi:hypothetical protein